MRRTFVLLNDRLRSWLMRLHGPVDVSGAGTEVVCRICKKPWPCELWTRAMRNR